MAGYAGILETVIRELGLDERTQRCRCHEIISVTDEAEDTIDGGERENIGATQPQPDTLEARHPFLIRCGGEVRAVDGPNRRTNHEVGNDVLSDERLEHAHLDGSEAAPAGEHQCRLVFPALVHCQDIVDVSIMDVQVGRCVQPAHLGGLRHVAL